MIISYFRSSSYNNWDFCQQQYFISYVLGQEQQSNQKADKGTIVHKVLECLANINLSIVKGQDFFIDEHLGRIDFDKKTILTKTSLSNEDVDKINKTRKNKDTYKNQSTCKLKYGAVRYGVELVEDLIEKSYNYYTEKLDHHEWKPVDFKDCTNFTWMTLDYKVGKKQGIFDPRKRDIIDVEPHFDFEIDEDWANYEFLNNKGEMTQGKLSLKGTIDLVTRINHDTIEIVDYKTGQRLNFATDEVKTYDYLKTDPQLLLYNKAARRMYPECKHVICTIFFIRDGGPFSIPMDESHVDLMKSKIQKRYMEITASTNPRMRDRSQKDWKCKYLCGYYKKNWPGTNHNMCKYIHAHTKKFGIDKTVEECTKEGHSVDVYSAPGEV